MFETWSISDDIRFRQEFDRVLAVDESNLCLDGVIIALLRQKAARSANPTLFWVDLGGGNGCAQSDILNNKTKYATYLYALNVDICYRQSTDKRRKLARYMKADVTNVQLPVKADLITCQFVIPYLYDPLRAIVNSYDQLEDGGLLSIGTNSRYRWSRGIRDPKDDRPDKHPMTRVLHELTKAGIGHATLGRESFYGDNERSAQQFFQLFVRKASGTNLKLDATVENVSCYSKNCYMSGASKIVTYRSDTSRSPVTVL